MNKLVELLNEYHFSGTEYIGYFLDEEENRIYFRTKVVDKGLVDEQRISDERIISKKFGFIKWLVDNDKIDRKKIEGLKLIPTLTYQNMIDDCDCGKSHWHPYTFVGYVDELLMLLAISDTPIDDLIGYLK